MIGRTLVNIVIPDTAFTNRVHLMIRTDLVWFTLLRTFSDGEPIDRLHFVYWRRTASARFERFGGRGDGCRGWP